MNFTREPIIETIISPKEGYKLSVRNSKLTNQEEISVDALEIVSFGNALFYRSLERPKSFLLPVSDYEVMEVRETRMVLKNASFEKNIKIGGGKESVRSIKEVVEEVSDEETASQESAEVASTGTEPRGDRKRDRRRNRRKRHQEDRAEARPEAKTAAASETDAPVEEGISSEKAKEVIKHPPFTGLIPPPPKLISETIARYKEFQIKEEPSEAKEEAPSEPSFREEDQHNVKENAVQSES